MTPNAYAKQIEWIRLLAADPKALSLKCLATARIEAHDLHAKSAGAVRIALHGYWYDLDTEYWSRLETLFPLLLAATQELVDCPDLNMYSMESESIIARDQASDLIDRIGAPAQPPAPSFKVGDYVVCTVEGEPDLEGPEYPNKGQVYQWPAPGTPEAKVFPDSQFRLATHDEVRQHLLATAAQQGYVVGNLVYGHIPITHVLAWIPGDHIRNPSPCSVNAEAAIRRGQPFVCIWYGPFVGPISHDMRPAPPKPPEPTHYLYRVWMRGDVVNRVLEVSGAQSDMDSRCRDVNDSLDSKPSDCKRVFYKVYPKQMPEREVV